VNRVDLRLGGWSLAPTELWIAGSSFSSRNSMAPAMGFIKMPAEQIALDAKEYLEPGEEVQDVLQVNGGRSSAADAFNVKQGLGAKKKVKAFAEKYAA
jgi:hypothetical protein